MHPIRKAMAWAGVAVAWMGAMSAAHAAPPSDAEQQAVWKDVDQASRRGPVDIPLADQAVLHLPAREIFVPQPQASRLLVMMGNPGRHDEILGLVLPQDGSAGWFMPIRFEKSGYVKDDDAKHWDAAKLLDSVREATAEANKERSQAGVPEMEIVGWAEPPAYDAAHQRLVWAIAARDAGAAASAPQGVNYNTYALGRDGYFSLNLVGGLADLPQLKPVAAEQLAALDYKPGKRYADFNEKTDHVAEYGLAALVVGVAAKKLGLIALGAAFIAKFAKVILLAVAALGGGFLKIFRRKPKPAPDTVAALPDAFAPTRPSPAPTDEPAPDAPSASAARREALADALPAYVETEPTVDPYAETTPMSLDDLPEPAPAPVAVPAATRATPVPASPPEAADDGPAVDPYAETAPMPLHDLDPPPPHR